MSGVLVLVVLLGMWAFVLVPLVRHRNERADEIRSVARFSSALRVLSRGHGSGGPPGMRQWVMPPRAGIAAARARRLESSQRLASASVSVKRGTVSRAPVVGAAAQRRRRVLISLAVLVVLTLLLVVLRRSFVPVQIVSDVLFVLGAFACKWSADQERSRARLTRRREAARRRASLVASAPGVRRSHGSARVAGARRTAPARAQVTDEFDDTLARHAAARRRESVAEAYPADPRATLPVMTIPLDGLPVPGQRAEFVGADRARVMTVPLDAAPRRAVLDEVAAEPVRPAGPHRLLPDPTWERGPRRPVSPPVAEPVVLDEIDLDWEPAVAEPASGVRLVDLTTSGVPTRRTKLFDDAEPVDLGDDSGLEALISRRAAASGW